MSLFLTNQEKFKLKDQILMDKLSNTLPDLMVETGIDMWIVIGDEYNECPVLKTLLPSTHFQSRGKSILIFSLQNGELKPYIVSKPEFNIEAFYEPILLKPPKFDFETFYKTFGSHYDLDYIISLPVESQFPRVGRLIEEVKPDKIAIGFSRLTAFSDGLSYSNYKSLISAISPIYYKRIISSEQLVIRWLETRTELELDHLKRIVYETQAIIKKAFSSQVIQKNQSTIGHVRYFMMDEAEKQGLRPWFNTTVWVKRKGHPHLADDDVVIKENDLLHCDFGLEHLNLCSDLQEIAFVMGDENLLKEYQAIHKKCMQLQDIVLKHMKIGVKGNDVLKLSLEEAKAKGIERPMVYTHPIGNYGHGPGPAIGRFGNQDYIDDIGDLLISKDTCFALELNVREWVPSLDMVVLYGLETEVIIREQGHYIVRQEDIHII